MKNVVLFCVLTLLFSCKRECDCEQQFDTHFQSELIDLPVNKEVLETSTCDVKIYIQENNVLKLDKTVMTIEQIDSTILMALENDSSPKLSIFPHPKSNFETFNKVLNLANSHKLKLIIGQ